MKRAKIPEELHHIWQMAVRRAESAALRQRATLSAEIAALRCERDRIMRRIGMECLYEKRAPTDQEWSQWSDVMYALGDAQDKLEQLRQGDEE